MHAAAYAKAHTVLGSCSASTAMHVCQCSSTAMQWKLLPQKFQCWPCFEATATAECNCWWDDAAAYAKAHTVLGSCSDSTAVHVCQCTSTVVQCKLLPQTGTLLYSNRHSWLHIAPASVSNSGICDLYITFICVTLHMCVCLCLPWLIPLPL